MPRISISITNEENEWLDEHPWLSPSGLFKDALRRQRDRELGGNKSQMKNELIRRIMRMKPEFRIIVRIYDKNRYFNFGPTYPIKDITELIEWIVNLHKKCKGMIEPDKTLHFQLKANPNIDYATVTFIKEFDAENNPIIEFQSQVV